MGDLMRATKYTGRFKCPLCRKFYDKGYEIDEVAHRIICKGCYDKGKKIISKIFQVWEEIAKELGKVV